MFLRRRNHGAIVDDRTAGDGIRPMIDRHGWIDEVAVCIQVTGADFRELARASADWILMAVRACARVIHRSQTCSSVIFLLIRSLIGGERVAGRLCESVAVTL